MDVWDSQQMREDRHGRHRRQNPSFSSSLLDAIYRSIDESNGVDGEEQQVILYRETMRKKQSIGFKDDEVDDDRLNFRRACMIEKWMEKKVSEKVVVRRSSMADFDRKARNVRDRDRDRDRGFKKLMNSSSSSSESSCGGGFSSSESESRSSSYTMLRPRPIRTEKAQFDGQGDGLIKVSVSIPNQKPKHENGFVKTKSKALKIYGDLKKVKQPISPGGRLATFLNSLFNGGSPKKQKFTNSAQQNDAACIRKSKSAHGSTCSSASSFSRSCLSKTPSSGEKLVNNGSTKRSVRFCPVSVILDEDSRPCGHKSLQDELGLMAAATTLRNALRNDHCRAEEESSEDLMNSYQKKIDGDVYINREEEEEDEDEEELDDDEEDDDDAVSCSSSDLFELDNLSSIGIERYREELPVYETTHFSTNQAIASGLIL